MEQNAPSRLTLDALDPRIVTPGCDVAAVAADFVHLGFGGFHRAHMARYTHDVMGLQPAALVWHRRRRPLAGGKRMYDALAPQGGLYTLDDWVSALYAVGAARREKGAKQALVLTRLN